jgi:hypothetical protein
MGTSSTLSAGRSEGLGEGGCAANPSYEPLRDRPAARLAEPDLIPPPWPGAYAPVAILISGANEMRGSQTGSQRRQTSGDARQASKRLASGSIPPARVTRLRPGTASRPAHPCARPSTGAPRRRRTRRTAMTQMMTSPRRCIVCRSWRGLCDGLVRWWISSGNRSVNVTRLGRRSTGVVRFN